MGNVAAFTLTTSATSGTYPFMIGHPFRKGDVPSGSYAVVNLTNSYVHPLSYWNDGSLKHAAIIGRASLSSTPTQVTISTTGTSSPGTPLTYTNIQSVLNGVSTAYVTLGSFGTVNLSTLIASPPTRTYLSCAEMVECHYYSQVGTDAQLYVWFQVRLFADNRVFIRVIVGNGYLDNGSNSVGGRSSKTYVPTVSIGGSTVWNNNNSSFIHSFAARWDQTGWINGTDPKVTPKHDIGYLSRTNLIPNYWKQGSSTEITSWGQPTKRVNVTGSGEFTATLTYTPSQNMAYTPNMGIYGYQDQIGLLPTWEALYCVSAHPTMYKLVLDHVRAFNSFGTSIPAKSTGNPVLISSFTNWSADGPSQGGAAIPGTYNNVSGVTNGWEGAHHPSAGFLAFLITADYYALETLNYNANAIYLDESSSHGSGVNRDLTGQMRARGWSYRTLAQLCAISPTTVNWISLLHADLKTWFGNLMTAKVTRYVTPTYTSKWMGLEFAYSNRLWSQNDAENAVNKNGTTTCNIAAWEAHFLSASLGYASQIDALSDMTAINTYANHVLKFPIWINGPKGDSYFHFHDASAYTFDFRVNAGKPGTFDSFDPVNDFAATDPGQVWKDNFTDALVVTVPNSNFSISSYSIVQGTFNTSYLSSPITVTYNAGTRNFTFPNTISVQVNHLSTYTNYSAGTSVPLTYNADLQSDGQVMILSIGVRLHAYYYYNGDPTNDNAIINFTIGLNSAYPQTNTTNPNTLDSTQASSSIYYFSNSLPSIAYAVDCNAANPSLFSNLSGAGGAFGNITGATNFSSTVGTANYDVIPTWAVVPKSFSQFALTYDVGAVTPTPVTPTPVAPSPVPTPVTPSPAPSPVVPTPVSPTPAAIAGSSTRVDSSSLITGATVVGVRGLGIKGVNIPSDSLIYSYVNQVTDLNNEFYALITSSLKNSSGVASGSISMTEDGTYLPVAPSAGSYNFNYTVYKNGQAQTPATLTLTYGVPTASITSLTIIGNNITLTGNTTGYPSSGLASLSAISGGTGTIGPNKITLGTTTFSVSFPTTPIGSYSSPTLSFSNTQGSNSATGGSPITILGVSGSINF